MKKVAFVVGTTAEIIKISEVFKKLQGLKDLEVEIWSTQQQATEIEKTLKTFLLPTQKVKLSSRNTNLNSKIDAFFWAVSVIINAIRNRRYLKPDLIIVHGDTLSTLLGCLIGKFYGVKVSHIEAGLRSGNILIPFPEELNRTLVGYMADFHFCPDQESFDRMRTKSKNAIFTYGNTGIDALRNQFNLLTNQGSNRVGAKSAIVVLHRTELISKKKLILNTFKNLNMLGNEFNIKIILDSPTINLMKKYCGNDWEKYYPNLNFRNKLTYLNFVELLINSNLVLTDSGGLQEECFRLGIPCLVYRNQTERSDGIGINAMLMGIRPDLIVSRFREAEKLQCKPNWPASSPSEIVVKKISEFINE